MVVMHGLPLFVCLASTYSKPVRYLHLQHVSQMLYVVALCFLGNLLCFGVGADQRALALALVLGVVHTAPRHVGDAVLDGLLARGLFHAEGTSWLHPWLHVSINCLHGSCKDPDPA